MARKLLAIVILAVSVGCGSKANDALDVTVDSSQVSVDCIRVEAWAGAGAKQKTDFQTVAGQTRYNVAVFAGAALGSGAVTLQASGYRGACGATLFAQSPATDASFASTVGHISLVLARLACPSCGTDGGDSGTDSGIDAGTDAGTTDSGVDGGNDGGLVAGLDGGGDAGVDAGRIDAGLDAGPVDAGRVDAGFDAGIDAGTDAGTDSGVDAGDCNGGALDAGEPCSGGICAQDGVCATGFPYPPSNFDAGSITAIGGPLIIDCVDTLDTTINSPTVTVCTRTVPVQVINQPGGSPALLVSTRALLVTDAGFLQMSGTRPVIFAVFGDATVDGTLEAGAPSGGPGANVNCAATTSGSDGTSTGGGCGNNGGGSGAGGAGFLTAGGTGGSGAQSIAGGAAGAVTPSAPLIPLRGGCPGGSGGGPPGSSGSAGSGGGAVQISSSQAISVQGLGVVSAAGGGGGPASAGAAVDFGGGGGGAGGAVLLEALTIATASTSAITANGGGGGGGGSATTVGATAGGNGSRTTAVAAAGGVGGDSGGGAAGGSGGALNVAPAKGTSTGCSGGGGGGAAGRIRFNGIRTCTIAPSTVISPKPTSNRVDAGCP